MTDPGRSPDPQGGGRIVFPKGLIYCAAALSCLVAATAVARVTRVNDCVFTIGNFCPLESIGATVAGSLLLGFVLFGLRWLFHTAAGRLPRASAIETAKSDPNFAAEIQHGGQIRTWREALEKLPVDKYLVINGFNVWKLGGPGGRVYFSGDRTYASIDELLKSYNIR